MPCDWVADRKERRCPLLDVLRDKKLYGRRVLGLERRPFLIGPDGLLRREWRGVRGAGQVREVPAAACDLSIRVD